MTFLKTKVHCEPHKNKRVEALMMIYLKTLFYDKYMKKFLFLLEIIYLMINTLENRLPIR